MQPRFTRAEYWILELVVSGSWPLTYLGLRNIEEFFNKPGHGLGYESLVDTLERLFGSGLIVAGSSTKNAPASILSRAGIVAALREPTPRGNRAYTYYQLTRKGAHQWEAFAMPNSSRYILDGSDWEKGKGQLTCMDKSWLELYLKNFSAMEGPVDPSSIKYRTLGPWWANYWKRLPKGYRVQFHYSPGKWDQDDRQAVDRRAFLATNGWCDFGRWYKWD